MFESRFLELLCCGFDRMSCILWSDLRATLVCMSFGMGLGELRDQSDVLLCMSLNGILRTPLLPFLVEKLDLTVAYICNCLLFSLAVACFTISAAEVACLKDQLWDTLTDKLPIDQASEFRFKQYQMPTMIHKFALKQYRTSSIALYKRNGERKD